MTLLAQLIESVCAACKVNASVQTQAAAILWTVREWQWELVAGLRG